MSACPRSNAVVKEHLNAQGHREYIRPHMRQARCECGAVVPIEPVTDAYGWSNATLPEHEQAGPIRDHMAEQREAWVRQGFGPDGPPPGPRRNPVGGRRLLHDDVDFGPANDEPEEDAPWL